MDFMLRVWRSMVAGVYLRMVFILIFATWRSQIEINLNTSIGKLIIAKYVRNWPPNGWAWPSLLWISNMPDLFAIRSVQKWGEFQTAALGLNWFQEIFYEWHQIDDEDQKQVYCSDMRETCQNNLCTCEVSLTKKLVELKSSFNPSFSAIHVSLYLSWKL